MSCQDVLWQMEAGKVGRSRVAVTELQEAGGPDSGRILERMPGAWNPTIGLR